jgi:methyltransferase (TIGR00027 family)
VYVYVYVSVNVTVSFQHPSAAQSAPPAPRRAARGARRDRARRERSAGPDARAERRASERPSRSARAVALARAGLRRASSPGGDPAAEERLYASLPGQRWRPIAARLRRWIAARTAFFDHVTLEAIAGGTTQVVILGAGYDGRALRFRAPGVRFFEVDRPATQEDKRGRLRALGVALDDVTFIAHDLGARSLAGALEAAGHARGAKTLYLCEGVLLYLPPAAVERLMRELHERSAPGSALALSFREHMPHAGLLAKARSAVRGAVLAAAGEPRRARLRPGELTGTLERTGWRVARAHAYGPAGRPRRGLLVLAQARAAVGA